MQRQLAALLALASWTSWIQHGLSLDPEDDALDTVNGALMSVGIIGGLSTVLLLLLYLLLKVHLGAGTKEEKRMAENKRSL